MPAATVTPRQLVKGALNLIGAVDREQTLTGTELNDGIVSLNGMLASWGMNKLKVPVVTQESFSVVSGTASYTIGEGATWDTGRPTAVLSAFLRDSAGSDTYLELLGRDAYNRNPLKSQSGVPDGFYYHPTSPHGTFILSCKPSASETIHIDSQKDISYVSDPDTAIGLPAHYSEALKYHLGIRLAPEYGLSVSQEHGAVASDLMNDLQTLNSEPFDVVLDLPLVRNKRRVDINGPI